MKDNMVRWVAGATMVLSSAVGVQADESIETRLQALQAEVNQLKAEQIKSGESLADVLDNAANGVAFGAALESEVFYGESGGESESDLALATAEFTIDAEITEGLNAHVGLLWEEDDTEENNLDEAFVTFGATEDIPYYLTVGKLYLPFGNFESAFISDPLTLELGEINESAAVVGYANDTFEIAAGAFKGDSADDTTLENLVASITVHPCSHSTIGAYWISDLVETDGLEDYVDAEKVGAAGIFLNAQIGEVAFNAEYITALGEIDTGTEEFKPSAYNIEASMPFSERLELGARFERSDEFAADHQYGVVAAYAVNDHVTVASEYMHAEGLDDDEDGNLFTAQLAVEF